MKIFDTHTHTFPDEIAEKVVANLAARSLNIPYYTNGTYSDLYAHAMEAGYTGWMNCPVVTKPGQWENLNKHAAEKNHWPTLSLGGLHPDDKDHPGILHQIRDLGLHGIKLHPEYQAFQIFDNRMTDVWETCESESIPVLIHGGNDIGFQPPYHSRPADYAELVRRYPGLILIAAHTGGWLVWDEVEEFLVGTNVYMDTSFTLQYIKSPEQFLRILKNHGTDKILFGTDSPWTSLKKSVGEILALNLSQQDKEDILWNNAAKLWNLNQYIQ